MMRLLKLYAVVGLTALTVLGLGAADETFKLTAKVGDSRSYKLVADLTSGELSAKVTGNVIRKVTKVDTDGSITVEETRSHLNLETQGNLLSEPDAVLVKVLKADGTTAELRGEGIGPDNYRAINLSTLKLPGFALAVDKTWTWDIPDDPKHGGVKAHAEYKVVGDEKLHDIDTWKISFSVSELKGTPAASCTSTVWISKADASLVKSESTVKNLPIGGKPMSGTQTLDMTS